MESLTDYRNPAFGLLIFAIMVVVVAILNYTFVIYKKKSINKKINDFINSFEKEMDFVDFKTIIDKYTLPVETILFIATSFYKSGDFDKSIRLCTNLIEIETDRLKRQDIFKLLGKTYLKAGFMQRSKNIFLKILEMFPRNRTVLKDLLIIYESLKEYENAMSVLTPLEELGCMVDDERVYLKALMVSDNATMTPKQKAYELISLYKQNSFIQRVVAQFLIENKIDDIWSVDFDYENIIDLLWFLPKERVDLSKIKENRFLQELYSAKGYVKLAKDSKIFELAVLINLKGNLYNNATLSFEYCCANCKYTYPVNDYRCPNCLSILSLKTELILTKKQDKLGYNF